MEKYSVAILMNPQFKDEKFIIVTDPRRLKQILSGFIENALRYTNKGVVEFGYFVNKDKQIQFHIADSGQGELAKAGQLLLENFNRINNSGGAGANEVYTGLRIAKGVVDAMGGNIWVENNAFNGSTFHLTIPYIATRNNQRQIQFETEFRRVI